MNSMINIRKTTELICAKISEKDKSNPLLNMT